MDEVYHALNPWWEGKEFETGIAREEYLNRLPACLARKQVEILIGSRRAGKTTIIKQFIRSHLESGVSPRDVIYLALDHPALSGMTVSGHLRNFRRMFMHDRDRELFLFLDEVQESPNWEAELKSIYDTEPVKMFCTGSTSSLVLSQGGKLTGRQIVNTIFPLSFKEFVTFKGELPGLSEGYKYEKLAEEFLKIGGYPEQVLNPSPEYMSNLLEDILARDLIRLYPIKKAFVLKDMMRLIASSVGSRTSYNKLSKVLGLSLDTVKEYIGYLETAFLLSTVEKWTTSHSEKVYAQKKIYLCDNGIKTLLTGGGDEGAKAESAVFMEMKRMRIPCGYFAESEREVDFVVGSVGDPMPVEVKYLSELDWGDKRFSGVRLFLKRFPRTRHALLVTRSVEREFKAGDVTIKAVPLWKFLIDPGMEYRGKEVWGYGGMGVRG